MAGTSNPGWSMGSISYWQLSKYSIIHVTTWKKAQKSFYFLNQEEWQAKHVRQSQNMLQIVTWSNLFCCKLLRTNYQESFPQIFLFQLQSQIMVWRLIPKKRAFWPLFSHCISHRLWNWASVMINTAHHCKIDGKIKTTVKCCTSPKCNLYH